jgi:hypothetical protein
LAESHKILVERREGGGDGGGLVEGVALEDSKTGNEAGTSAFFLGGSGAGWEDGVSSFLDCSTFSSTGGAGFCSGFTPAQLYVKDRATQRIAIFRMKNL